MSSKIKKKDVAVSREPMYNFWLVPIGLAVAIIPLIVRYYAFNTGLAEYDWFGNRDEHTDFFLYYKSFFFIILSGIMLLLTAVRLIREGRSIKWTNMFIPLLAYGLLSLISTLLSDYVEYGLKGINEQFESVFSLLGYVIIAYYTYLCVSTERDVKYIIGWLTLCAFVMLYIGFTQAFTTDFYKTDFAQRLIAPASIYSNGGLTFQFEPGRVYLSLYNPNYVGSYVSLVVPVFAVLAFFRREIGKRIVYAVVSVGLILCLFGSQSRSGILGMCAALVVLIVLMRTQIIKYWKISLTAVVAVIAAFVLINVLSDNNVLWNRLKTVFDPNVQDMKLEAIYTNDDNVEVVYDNAHYYFTYVYEESNETITVFGKYEDGSSIQMDYNEEKGMFDVRDEKFPISVDVARFAENTTAGIPAAPGICLFIEGKQYAFTNAFNNTYLYWTPTGKYSKINNAESAVFTDVPSFASGRGYIWSRTIPLLKKTILLGTGADTFVLEFPNNDYVGLTQAEMYGSLITKPHNMYLQIGVQSGVLALAALVLFYIFYFIDSIKVFWRSKFDSYLSWAGLGIFIGTLGYMITGLANDSTVTVAPIFWALIGAGLAINRELKNAATR